MKDEEPNSASDGPGNWNGLTSAISAPLKIINSAIKAVPAVKYALGVAGLVSVVSIVAYLKISPPFAVFGIIVLFVLMCVLVVFSKLTQIAPKALRPAALILVYFSVFLFLATASLLFSSAFFNVPIFIRDYINANIRVGSISALVLPSDELIPPFRVHFIDIADKSLDFVIKRKMDKRWEETLRGQPYIVENRVTRTLLDLINEDSKDRAPRHESKKATSSKGEDSDYMPYFSESMLGYMMDRPLSVTEAANLFNHKEDWEINYAPSDGDPVDLKAMLLRKTATRVDFLNFFKDSPEDESANIRYWRFLKHVAREYMPDDFCYMDVNYGEYSACQTGYDGTYFLATLIPRVVKLRVLIIQNLQNHKIKVGKFFIAESNKRELRTSESDATVLKSVNLKPEELLPSEILSEGESILIPLAIVFYYDQLNGKDAFSGFLDDSSPELQRIRSDLERSSVVKFPVDYYYGPWNQNHIKQSLVIKSSILLDILNRPKRLVVHNREYVYGPSIKIDSIEIDGKRYPVREFDPERIIAREGYLWASCPYVFSYSNVESSWLSEGNILVNIDSKEKEQFETRELKHFDGKIMIRELDPEISYIDFLCIKFKDKDGFEHSLLPNNPLLSLADGQYLVLHKGEQAVIEFDTKGIDMNAQFSISSKGYYLPLIPK